MSQVARLVLDIIEAGLRPSDYMTTKSTDVVILDHEPFPQKVMWT